MVLKAVLKTERGWMKRVTWLAGDRWAFTEL